MADSPSELELEIEKLERKHAEHPEGRFFVPLANAYRKMGDVETAEALLRSGVERHPDYLSAHIVLGRCLADRGAVREAEEEFRFVLSQDPQNLIALRTLGELASADGRTAEAAEWYRELLAVDPMNEDARQALETLSDAPAAAEMEEEFRSGAGWWEPSSTTDQVSGTAGTGEPDGGDRDALPADDTLPASSEGDSAWAGYGDLPGLREPDALDDVVGDTGTSDGVRDYDADTWAAFPDPSERALTDAELEASEPGDLERMEAAAGGFDAPRDFGAAQPTPDAGDQDAAPATPPPALDDEEEFPASPHEAHGVGGGNEVVTETIAELYARQGLHDRAASVYRELIRRRGGDAALEQRLEEIERTARQEQEQEGGLDVGDDAADVPAEEAPLAFADEEALLTPALDAEPPVDDEGDPFAASFAEGFTTVDDQDEEATPPFDDEPADLAATSGDRPAGGGGSITQFLSALAAWKPAAGDLAEPGRGTVEVGADEEAIPDLEPWEGAPAPATPQVEPLPWEDRFEESPVGGRADDFLELDAAPAESPAGGTGSAGEEEPFPWEMPGAITGSDEGERDGIGPSLDPFFVDDVEPTVPQQEPALPESPREPEPGVPAPGASASPGSAETDEDEDLESFQAWLRSLKR